MQSIENEIDLDYLMMLLSENKDSEATEYIDARYEYVISEAEKLEMSFIE